MKILIIVILTLVYVFVGILTRSPIYPILPFMTGAAVYNIITGGYVSTLHLYALIFSALFCLSLSIIFYFLISDRLTRDLLYRQGYKM